WGCAWPARGQGATGRARGPKPRVSIPLPATRFRHDEPGRPVDPEPGGVHDEVVVGEILSVAPVIGLHVLVALAVRLAHHMVDVGFAPAEALDGEPHSPRLRSHDVD